MRIFPGRIRVQGTAPAGSEPLGTGLDTRAPCPGQVRVGEGSARPSQPAGSSCLSPRAAAGSGWGLAGPCPCPCLVPAGCSSFCFPHPRPCPVTVPPLSPSFLIPVPASSPSQHHFPFSSSPSLPFHHPCLVPFPASFPIFLHPHQRLSLSLPVPIPASFPIFPVPSTASQGSPRSPGPAFPGTCCGFEPPGPRGPGPLPLPGPICGSHKALAFPLPSGTGRKASKAAILAKKQRRLLPSQVKEPEETGKYLRETEKQRGEKNLKYIACIFKIAFL